MRRILSIATLLVLCAAWTGCVRDDSVSPDVSQGRSMTLTVNLRIPGSSSGETRSDAPADDLNSIENTATELDMLLFKWDTINTEYVYHSSHYGRLEVGSFKFRNAVPEDEQGQNMYLAVFIANGHADVVAALASVNVGDVEESVLNKLVFSTKKHWLNDGQSTARSLPMYGSSSFSMQADQMLDLTIDMLRAVARVDVVSKAAGFGIAEVRVVNTMDISSFIPNMSGYDIVTLEVTKPNIVEGANRLDVDGANLKVGIQTPEDPSDPENQNKVWGTSIEGIYVGEAAAGDAYMERNCILVNVPQKNADGQMKDNWYRVDLQEKKSDQTEAEPCAILRNHHYVLNINNVYGPGYPTPEEAFENISMNVDCQILDWEMGMNQGVMFADDYSLSVNRSEVLLYNTGIAEKDITVATTYTDGWETENTLDWLTITPSTGASDSETTLSFSTKPFADGEKQREGYFWITAGKLKKKIYITQVNRANELSLELTPEMVTFPLAPQNSQMVTAIYSPSDAKLTMEVTPGDPGITDSDWNGGKPALKANVVSLLPNELSTTDGVSERTATLTFTLTSADGARNISKSVEVIQSGEGAFFIVDPHDKISSLQTDVTFKVRSAVDWSLKGAQSATAASDVAAIDLVTWDKELQLAAIEGRDFLVTVPANDTWKERTWYFVPTSDYESWPQAEDGEEPYGSWSVVQEAGTPTLSVTPTTVDFGSGAEPARIPVTISTNAKWSYTNPSTNAWVVGSAEAPYVSAGTTYGKDTPATTNEYDIYFGSQTFAVDSRNNVVGTLPKTGEYNATVEFSTVADGAASGQKTASVTFKRTVPGFLRPPVNKRDLDVYPLELTRLNGGTVTLQFQTNASWVAGYIENNEEVFPEGASKDATAFGPQKVELKVGSDTEWHLPIPDPNSSSRGVRVFVRSKDVMAENEPSELYYDLKIDKYYVKEASLKVNGKKITPGAADTIVFPFGSTCTAEVKITGNIPVEGRYLSWGDNNAKELIKVTNGQSTTETRTYKSDGWWGTYTFPVQFEHGCQDADKGIFELGKWALRGHDGKLKLVDTKGKDLLAVPADSTTMRIAMDALDGSQLPDPETDPLVLNAEVDGVSITRTPLKDLSSSSRIVWEVPITANTHRTEKTDPKSYYCYVRGKDFTGKRNVDIELKITHLGTKPGEEVYVNGVKFKLGELKGGYPNIPGGAAVPGLKVTRTPSCEVYRLNPGDVIVWPEGSTPLAASNNVGYGDTWLFAYAPFTIETGVTELSGVHGHISIWTTSGPVVTLKKDKNNPNKFTVSRIANPSDKAGGFSNLLFVNELHDIHPYILCKVNE